MAEDENLEMIKAEMSKEEELSEVRDNGELKIEGGGLTALRGYYKMNRM
ncbi:MAG: hypothetical protein WC659_01015 [Patescibacteria group bacterium]